MSVHDLKPIQVAKKDRFFAPEHSDDVRDGTETTKPLTEIGNALRFLEKHKSLIKYIPESKTFIIWKNGAWEKDEEGARVREMIAHLPADIYAEGAKMISDSIEFAKWARKSQDRRVIIATTELFKDFSDVRVNLSTLDSEHMKVGLNYSRQIIDLTTGECRDSLPEDLITKSLNVDYLGDAEKAVLWLKFLDDVFNGNQPLIDWVKRWCGYILTGDISEQVFLFCFGCGSNGKSVFAETLHEILGDYSKGISSETLTVSNKGGADATPDIAALSGIRLGLSTETSDGSAFNESRLKGLVSGDVMPARFLNKGFFDLKPILKLMILGNHKPTIKGSDDGIWRRVLLLPFEKTFSGDKKDKQIKNKLLLEAPHILAWMVEGAVEWGKMGLSDVPTAIKVATDEYRSDQDIMGIWLLENCQIDVNAKIKDVWSIQSKDSLLYNNYRDWCLENGMKSCTKSSWTRRIKERGFYRKNISNRYEYGIGVNYIN